MVPSSFHAADRGMPIGLWIEKGMTLVQGTDHA
jgi:hypothetical protein